MRFLFAALMAAALVVVVPVGSPAGAAEAAVGSTYTALSPTRVLDTRSGRGPVGAGGTTSVDLAGLVPASATAVVFNLTGTEPTADTYVTVSPHGQARPVVSNLNLRPGETRANLVTVAVGADRVLDLYNNAGSTHLIVDLAGYYATGTGAKFLPTRPSRVLDTTVGPWSTTTLDLSQTVPSSATSVVLNVTVADATADTFVTAWPAGGARPNASSVNVPAGGTNPGLTTVALGAGQSVNLFNHVGQVRLVVDLQGFYTPDFGAVFTPVAPQRVFDTRDGTGSSSSTPLGPQGGRGVHPGGAVPGDAIGAVVNITGIEPTADTHVTAWQANRARPETSNLNLGRGRTAANLSVVEIQYDPGQFRFFVYNNAGETHVAMDLAGYFSVPAPPCTHDCAYVWGGNHAQLGNGTTTGSSMPSPLHGLSGVVSVASRTALLADGSVWTWGSNWYGTLGHGWKADAAVPFPVRVPGFTGAVDVANASGTHYALRADGTVWSWGSNGEGALGTGGVAPFPSRPQQIPGLTGVTAIAAGSVNGYALRGDGTVWSWGWNHEGQLGTGSTAGNSSVPVQVSGLTGVVKIAAGGNNAFAVTADGALWAWGANYYGTLGAGTRGDFSRVPVRVSGLTGVIAVDGDSRNSFAVRDDGSVWSWGWSGFAGLGDGTDSVDYYKTVPGRVDGISGAVDVVAHEGGGQVLDAAGRLWVWGWNSSSDLGTPPSGIPALRPIQSPVFSRVTALGDGGQALVPTP